MNPPADSYDLHATALHQIGVDHERLAMGEAAGTAAAMAVAAKKSPQEINGVKVREALKAVGAGPFTEA